MKDPAFLFYSSDFDQGTRFFTDEQTGIYIRLLVAQHQHGHLSEKHMKIICKSYDEDIYNKFKRDDDGNYYNERLDFEINKRKKFAESRSKNRKGKNICLSHDEHMENENENINRNKEDNKEISNKSESRNFVIYEPKVLYHEFMNSQQWRENILGSHYAKKITDDKLTKFIQEYIEIQRDTDGMGKTLTEFRRHFINWLRNQVERNGNALPVSTLDPKRAAAKIDNRGY